MPFEINTRALNDSSELYCCLYLEDLHGRLCFVVFIKRVGEK